MSMYSWVDPGADDTFELGLYQYQSDTTGSYVGNTGEIALDSTHQWNSGNLLNPSVNASTNYTLAFDKVADEDYGMYVGYDSGAGQPVFAYQQYGTWLSNYSGTQWGSDMIFSIYCTYITPCNIQPGIFQQEFTGGLQSVNSVEGVSGELDSYNPTPVFDSSSFWVMLCEPEEDNSLYYAQIGWVKDSTYSEEYVFIQYWDWSGNNPVEYTFYYDPTDQSWGNTPDYVPSGSITYSIYYDPNYETFYLSFSGGGEFAVSDLNWTPNTLEVMGETHNFETNSPVNLGDHVPGDTVVKAQAQLIQYMYEGQWWNSSLELTSRGNGGIDNLVNNPPGIRIWDTRCSN